MILNLKMARKITLTFEINSHFLLNNSFKRMSSFSFLTAKNDNFYTDLYFSEIIFKNQTIDLTKMLFRVFL